jgi:hypothetical protein
MAEPKVYKIPYDKERVQPLVKVAVSQASPLAYISLFLLVLVILFAYRFRDSIYDIGVVLIGIPVYVMVAIYMSNICKEYSRRKILELDHKFSISKDKVVIYEPTYNPSKVRKVVLKRADIRGIDLTFVSKKKAKIVEMNFRLKNGKEIYFLAELLDPGQLNLLQILNELDYPVKDK